MPRISAAQYLAEVRCIAARENVLIPDGEPEVRLLIAHYRNDRAPEFCAQSILGYRSAANLTHYPLEDATASSPGFSLRARTRAAGSPSRSNRLAR